MGWLKIIGFIGSPHEFFNEFPLSSWVARRWPVPPRKLGCCSTSQRKAAPKTVYSTSWRQWHPEIWQEYASHHVHSVSMMKIYKHDKTNLWGSQRNTTNQHQPAHLPCRRWLGVTAPSFGWALALQRPLHAGRCRRWPTVPTGAQWSSTRILEQLGESPKLVTCWFLSFKSRDIYNIASKYGDTVT